MRFARGQLPEPANLLAALDEGRGRTERGFTFIRGNGQEDFLSWDRLRSEAINCAAQLRAIGLKKGDRLAVVVPDARDFVPTFLGAAWAGVIPVPLHAPPSLGNLDSYADTLIATLNNAEPACLATSARLAGLLQDITRRVPSLKATITTEQLRAAAPDHADREPAEIDAQDIAFLQFTSGSTASPKGVEITHGGLRANAWAIMRDSLQCDSEKDHGVSWLPLTHDMGLVGFVLSPLFHKVQVTFIPPLSFVRNAAIWLETIHRKRATISFAPNFAYSLVTRRATASQIAKWDLSCMKAFGCGAEPINPVTMRAFVDKFSACSLKSEALLPCYGMAEATLAISFGKLHEKFATDQVDRNTLLKERRASPVERDVLRPEEAFEVVCCGEVIPQHEVAVVDDQGAALGERQVGEIWMRGPSIARGYYRDAKNTQRTFGGGWLRTGDLGYLVNGSVYVTGRKKDLIIVNGRNYDPQHIEWLADELPNVRNGSTIAFSVPGPATEGLVVIVESRTKEPEVLEALVKSRIAEKLQFVASDVIVASPGSYPKTPNGKHRRARARQQYLDRLAAGQRFGAGPSLEDPARAQFNR
jgi:fatty-acyl-CoA synthase